MSHDTQRTGRLEARIAPAALAIVKQAADLQGRSVSDFVVAAAQEAAQNAIEKTQIVRLAAEDQRRFAEALLKPQPLEPAMDRARDAYAQLVQG